MVIAYQLSHTGWYESMNIKKVMKTEFLMLL